MRYFPQKLELSPNILSAAVDTPAQETYTMNWTVTNPAPQDTAAGTITSKTRLSRQIRLDSKMCAVAFADQICRTKWCPFLEVHETYSHSNLE